MTTGQLAKRLKVHQPRVIELEKARPLATLQSRALSVRRRPWLQLVYILVLTSP